MKKRRTSRRALASFAANFCRCCTLGSRLPTAVLMASLTAFKQSVTRWTESKGMLQTDFTSASSSSVAPAADALATELVPDMAAAAAAAVCPPVAPAVVALADPAATPAVIPTAPPPAAVANEAEAAEASSRCLS
jgi:hypothetical protein